MKFSVVLTTINVPYALEAYVKNAKKFEYSDVEFIVMGDHKTPAETYNLIDRLNLESGYRFCYMGVREQEKLHRFDELKNFLPWNSISRRNLGYLIAYEHQADVIISIDDDNIPLENCDFFGANSIVGKEISCFEVESSSGWFNIGTMMQTNPPGRLYVRGFPLSKRWIENKDTFKQVKSVIKVNAGLCVGDPDVDTFTRIAYPCCITALNTPQLILSCNTWSPFNSQSTAFHRSLIPCMFLITFREGSEILAGNNTFRLDDIWMSYFIKLIMNKFGDRVCYGLPYLQQNRNFHNYSEDLRRELPALRMTDRLIELLDSIHLQSSNYQDCYDELIEILASTTKFSGVESQWLSEMVEGMRIWSRTTKRL